MGREGLEWLVPCRRTGVNRLVGNADLMGIANDFYLLVLTTILELQQGLEIACVHSLRSPL